MKLTKLLLLIGLSLSAAFYVNCSGEKSANTNKVEGTVSNTNKEGTSANAFVHEKIFVSEKFLKKKNSNKNSQINTAVSPSGQYSANGINDGVSSNKGVGKTSNLLNVAAGVPETNTNVDLNLGKGPVFYEGWIKYFKYTEEEVTRQTPRHFYRNNEFYNQMKLFPKANLTEKSEGKFVYIKDKTYFYGVLFTNVLNFVSARQVQLQKTFDSMNIDFIQTINEEPGFKSGGIQDFGNFNEGFCFKIITVKPRQSNWVLCTDTQDEKTKLMTTLKNLKLRMQRDQGIVSIAGNQSKETLSSILNPDQGKSQNLKTDQKGNLGVVFDAKQKITDGYWIVLQNWSQCNLKCGGGTSTLQRMCVPPKNGGAPCEGPAILTRKCNTQPCPNVLGTGEKKANNTVIKMKPIVKIMAFSSRPQRYTKCVIKEGDLMYHKNLKAETNVNNNPSLEANMPSDMESVQIPTRVVMNNRTVTIFSGEDYNTLVTTFNLAETSFFRSKKNKNCFILSENNKHKEVTLCPFGCDNISKAVEEWDYDFNLFKYQCNTPKDIIDIDQSSLDKKLQDKIRKAKKELLEEREKEIKKKLTQKEEHKIESVIKSTNQLALQAIQKEMNLEEMIKQEEAEREARIELEIKQNIEKEKKKSECIIKAIQERKLENQYNLRAKQAEEEISKIKQTAAEQVLIRRSQLKNTILKMRQKAQRRQRELNQQLHTVRMTVAEEMGKAYKKGEISKCIAAAKSPQDRLNYCTASFVDDFNALTNCKEAEDFCNICCDFEFGDFFVNERHNCYQTVCKISSPPASDPTKPIEGRWIWQNVIQ